MPIIDPGPRHWEPEEDGPCGLWPIDTECCPGFPQEPCDWEPRHLLAVEIATDLLWRLTAGQYGLCAELIRPCRKSCLPEDPYGLAGPSAGGSGLLRPYLFGGRWFNLAGCGCAAECSCGPLQAIDIPGPVHDVVEVRIDGEPLPQGAWRLQRFGARARLLRRDGGTWPSCQDMTRPETEPGTFSIMYLRGRRVPAAGVRAVSVLTCEVYKSCTGDASCRLGPHVRRVEREGESIEVFDPAEAFGKGLTGLREVDAWIMAVNPAKLTQSPAVFTLDLPAAPEHVRGSWEQQ